MPNLHQARWQKLVWNVPYNGLSVLLGAGTTPLMADADSRALIQALMAEVVQGAKACGHDMPPGYADYLFTMTEKMPDYWPSMYHDFLHKRPLELEAIYARPLAAAKAAGCELPRIEALYRNFEFYRSTQRLSRFLLRAGEGMAKNIDDKLVLAISSRALFDLSESHKVYLSSGVEAYRQYQIEHEDEILAPGDAFPLVKKLLSLNSRLGRARVEVILVSRNSADTGLRVFNSIHHYGLAISRAAFVGGRSPYPYLKAFGCDLFLSTHAEDVRAALDAGFAAATILSGGASRAASDELRIAFDGDAVIFSDESERVYQSGGLEAFQAKEREVGARAVARRAVQRLSGGTQSAAARVPRRRLPDPHGAGDRAFGAGPRAGDSHLARVGHSSRRIAVPRWPDQIGVS